MTRAHRRPGQGPRERHDPRRLRHARRRRARSAAAKCTRTTRSSSASRARSASGRSWAAGSSRSPKPTRCCANGASARSKDSGAGSASRSPRRSSLNDANEVGFDFGDGSGDDGAEAPDFTGQEPLGPCPKCSSRVFETAQAYVCEKAVGPDKTCDFRSGRVILQRPDRARRRWRSSSPPARPICCSSCRRAPSGRSRRFSCGNRMARSASSSSRAMRPKAARGAARGAPAALKRARAASARQEARRAPFGPLWPLREARRPQRDDSRPRQGRFADARRGGDAARRKGGEAGRRRRRPRRNARSRRKRAGEPRAP